MITRKEYLDGKVTHREYYASVVKLAGIRFDSKHALVVRASISEDEHYNDIPLKTWDVYADSAKTSISKSLRQHDDFFTLAGGVCVMKEAVRQAVEAMKDNAIETENK